MRQLLAQRNAFLPALSLVEVADDLLVEFLLPLPLWLPVVVVGQEGERVIVPAQHVGVQLQREAGFDEVLGVAMQVVEFVNVSEDVLDEMKLHKN